MPRRPEHSTGIGRQQAGEQAKQQGFTGAVRAENDTDTFAGKFQIQTVEHCSPLRGKTQATDLQREHQPYLRVAQQRST